MSIEGIPDGWELVRVGTPRPGEHVLGKYGKILHCNGVFKGISYVIIRKKDKQYRAFENGDEFLSHSLHDGWIKLSSTAFTKVSQFDEKRFWVNNEDACYTWDEGFNLLKFRDGTPFGVEVVE